MRIVDIHISVAPEQRNAARKACEAAWTEEKDEGGGEEHCYCAGATAAVCRCARRPPTVPDGTTKRHQRRRTPCAYASCFREWRAAVRAAPCSLRLAFNFGLETSRRHRWTLSWCRYSTKMSQLQHSRKRVCYYYDSEYKFLTKLCEFQQKELTVHRGREEHLKRLNIFSFFFIKMVYFRNYLLRNSVSLRYSRWW